MIIEISSNPYTSFINSIWHNQTNNFASLIRNNLCQKQGKHLVKSYQGNKEFGPIVLTIKWWWYGGSLSVSSNIYVNCEMQNTKLHSCTVVKCSPEPGICKKGKCYGWRKALMVLHIIRLGSNVHNTFTAKLSNSHAW